MHPQQSASHPEVQHVTPVPHRRLPGPCQVPCDRVSPVADARRAVSQLVGRPHGGAGTSILLGPGLPWSPGGAASFLICTMKRAEPAPRFAREPWRPGGLQAAEAAGPNRRLPGFIIGVMVLGRNILMCTVYLGLARTQMHQEHQGWVLWLHPSRGCPSSPPTVLSWPIQHQVSPDPCKGHCGTRDPVCICQGSLKNE